MKDSGSGAKASVWERHRRRHTPTGFEFALADRIGFLPVDDWNKLAVRSSFFLEREYLELLEATCLQETMHRYALIHDDGKPIACLAVQLFHWRAERLIEDGRDSSRFRQALQSVQRRALKRVDQRLLVCGNLVSSGLHGVAFSGDVDRVRAWSGVAEALYRIRRAEKLSGETDFMLVKDFKGKQVVEAAALQDYSYRRVRGEPDMVLTLPEECRTFDDYLALLNTKYRGKQKRIRRDIEKAGLVVEPLNDVAVRDDEIHALYSQVERRASVRMASLPPGYFGALAERFPDRVRFSAIRNGKEMAGFISTIKENDGTALAYYVGMDYEINARVPLYLRLLQCVIEDAMAMGCRKISFGRTAAEPKASLGAKPVETWFWVRHRLPAVNWFVRQLFPYLPYDEAPERSPFKGE